MQLIKYIGKKKIKIKLNEYWYYGDEKELSDDFANYLLKDETYSKLFIKVDKDTPIIDKDISLVNKVTKKLKEK